MIGRFRTYIDYVDYKVVHGVWYLLICTFKDTAAKKRFFLVFSPGFLFAPSGLSSIGGVDGRGAGGTHAMAVNWPTLVSWRASLYKNAGIKRIPSSTLAQ